MYLNFPVRLRIAAFAPFTISSSGIRWTLSSGLGINHVDIIIYDIGRGQFGARNAAVLSDLSHFFTGHSPRLT